MAALITILAEIRAEVDRAKTFPRPLDFYAIVITAKKSTKSQLAVLAINREQTSAGLFTVTLVTWDDINDFLNENADVADDFYGGISAQATVRIERGIPNSAAAAGKKNRDSSVRHEGAVIQWMRDPPQQLSVRLGSYLDGHASNRMDEASGTKDHVGDSSKSAGRNASEA